MSTLWEDKTSTGEEIISIIEDRSYGYVGITKGLDGTFGAAFWDENGNEYQNCFNRATMDIKGAGNLVRKVRVAYLSIQDSGKNIGRDAAAHVNVAGRYAHKAIKVVFGYDGEPVSAELINL